MVYVRVEVDAEEVVDDMTDREMRQMLSYIQRQLGQSGGDENPAGFEEEDPEAWLHEFACGDFEHGLQILARSSRLGRRELIERAIVHARHLGRVPA